MASRSLGTLTLDLVAKTGGYVAGLDKAERNTKKWRKNTKSELAAVGKSFALLSVGIASGLAAATIATVSRTKEIIDSQAKFADSVGYSIEALAGLEHATSINGATTETLRKGIERLTVNVNDFKKGIGEAVPAFERLGISLKDIEKLSPDELFGLIGDKLNEIPNQSERAALAYDLFGKSGIKLVKTLEQGTEGLALFKDEAKKLGLTLSRVDAAKVEAANDALTRANAVNKGFANRLTVELSPAIEAMADLYLEAALEAEGFGTTASFAGDAAIVAIGAMGDGWEGLQLIIIRNRQVLTEIAALTLKIASYSPGALIIDPFGTGFRKKLKESAAIFDELGDNYAEDFEKGFQRRIDEGSYSERFAKKLEENRKKLEAQINNPKTTGTETETPPTDLVVSAATKYIENLKLQVALLGKTNIEIELYKLKIGKASPAQLAMAESLLRTVDGFEKQAEAMKKSAEEITKINGEALAIHDSLRTEEEAIEESYVRRREIVLNNTKITGEAQKELLSRLAADRESQLENTTVNREQQAKLEALERDISAISDAMRTEEQVINDSYQRRKESILNYIQETGIAQTELLKKIEEDRQAQLDELEAKRRLVSLQNYELLFNGISSLAREFAGEQSTLYKVAFAIEKAAAIARAIVAIQAGIALASEAPFPANIAAMASVVSATAGIVSTIRGTSIEGQAHDGLDSVPRTGTYLLEKGERVTTEKTSAKLDRTLDRVQEGASGKNSVSIAQMIFPGVKNERDAKLAGGAAARKINQVLNNSSRYA